MTDPRRFPAAVVFDLDGTLIDSVGDISDVLNHVLVERGLKPLDEPTVATMVGGGARLLIERALARLEVERTEPVVAELHERFEARYLKIGGGRSDVYPGGRELIAELRQQGILLAICTNKPEAVAIGVVEALSLRDDFPVVIGETPARPRKPHPAMVEAALSALGVGSADAVMIGDTPADIDGAKAAGVSTVAVSYGYGTVKADALGADIVVDSLTAVPDALAALAMRKGSKA